MPTLTRRTALLSAAAAPAALAVSASAPALAAGHGGAAMPRARSFTLGDFQVTTLLSATMPREEPQGIFGLNVSAEEFAAVSEENFLPTDVAQFYFTPTLVNTGSEVILFDTGLSAESMVPALAEAGVTPDDITHVVITHMHGDHIGGLTTETGDKTYANAALITGQVEFDHWAGADNEGFEAKVRPFAEEFSFVGDAESIASGVTSVASFGHTPGHMTWMLESGGNQLFIAGDLANHHVYSVAYPDWEVRFDMDKPAAAAMRRQVLSMLAADKVPFVGYHMPFPAVGYVQPRDDGFRFVPVTYQMMG
ncbi:MAG: MBL fold metallo-hydrolase [Pseudomonadota bacterium]